MGVLRSTDGGTSWSQLATDDFANQRIKNLIPTSIDLDPGPGVQQVVLAGTISGNGITGSRVYSVQGGALFRSTDSGESFTQVTVAPGSTGAVTGLIADPNDDMRFYAAVPGTSGGVFRSDDGGVTWAPVNTGITGITASDVIELAVHDAGATTVLYAALANGDDVTGVFRSTDNGANWATLAGVPAAFNAGSAFAEKINLVADPVVDDVVYISGQGDGANILRYDPAGGGSWVNITEGGTASNTDPHADSRDLVFLNNTTLLQSDDGGFYFIQNPRNAAANDWQSFVGNMGAVEFYSTAYDNLNNLIFGGTQDNGTSIQDGPSSTTWDRFLGGDGQTSQAARSGGNVVRYSMSNNLTGFIRRTFDNTNTQVGATANVQLASAATPAVALSGLNATDAGFTGFFFFPYEVNATDSNRLLLGSQVSGGLYESANMGDVIADVTPAGMGPVTSVAYGATNNADAAYVTDTNGDVWVRTTATGAFTRTNFDATPGTGIPLDVIMDPNDFNIVYVVDANGVFQSTNAGGAWTELSENLGLLNSPLNLRSVALVQNTAAPGDGVLLVGGQGGVYRRLPALGLPGAANWTELGSNMPNTIAEDLRYDAADNLLIAGTFGRGAWTVNNAVDRVQAATVMNVCGDEDHMNQDDLITLARNLANPLILDVSINGVLKLGVPIATLAQINVFGQGGNDNLIVDSSNGLINVPNGIRYDGDGACPGEAPPVGLDRGVDTLTLQQTDGPTITSDTLGVGALPGSGVSTIVADPGNIQTVYFEELEPVVDNVPSPTFTINAGVVGSLLNESNAINYTASDLFGATWGKVTIDAFEPIHFTNKVDLSVDAGAGSDEISLNNPSTPTGLTGITINGGDPTAGSDTAIVSATAGDDAIVFFPTTDDDATVTGAGPVPITLATIEQAVIDAQGGSGDTLTYRTPTGEDSIHFTPGAEFSSGTIVAQNDLTPSGPLMPLAFTNLANVGAGALAFEDDSDDRVDDLFVAGTDNDESFNVSDAGEVTVRAVGDFSLIMPQISTQDGVDHLTLLGLSGVDRFAVAGNHPFDDGVGAGAGLVVEGGDSDGDLLLVRGEDGTDDDFRVNPGLSIGSVEVNLVSTIYTGVEHLQVGGDPADTDTLRINDFFEDNQWTVRQSSFLIDVVQIDQRESIEYFFFDNVTLFNFGGTDTFRVYPTNLSGFTTDLRIMANAGAGDPVDDVVEIIGTEGVDTVTSDADTITMNGTAVTILDDGAGLAQVTVATLGGDDEIDLDLDLAGVLKRVEAGDGDDNVNLAGTMDADIFGGLGNDIIVGSPLADRIYGGPGNDRIEGGAGNDTIYGEAGNDRLEGNEGNDLLLGGDDDDFIRWEVGDGSDTNLGGQGIDELLFVGDGTDESFAVFQNDDSVARISRNGAFGSTLTSIEDLLVLGQDGADTFEIEDLYTSDIRNVALGLGVGDAAADAVIVHGRNLADDLLITAFEGGASAFVKGLRYDVIMSGESAAEGDTLNVRGNFGDDSIKAADGVEAFIGIILDGNDGDDFLVGRRDPERRTRRRRARRRRRR